MADKSWMKPGVTAWLSRCQYPEKVSLYRMTGDGAWSFLVSGHGGYGGDVLPDFAYQTEMEAHCAFLEDAAEEMARLQKDVDRSRARIAELESASDAAGQQ